MLATHWPRWTLGALLAPRAWPWSAWAGAPTSDDDAELEVLAGRRWASVDLDTLLRAWGTP